MACDLVFMPDELKGWVIECHGLLEDVRTYYLHYTYNGKPVRKWFTDNGYAFIVPFLDDPRDGAEEVLECYGRFSQAFYTTPLLTAQCMGGLTAFDVLARVPGVFRGAALLHPMSIADFDYSAITDPVKIWHGASDTTAPVADTIALPFESVIVNGGSHLQMTVTQYLADMSDFIRGIA